jgi:hypothetical protein
MCSSGFIGGDPELDHVHRWIAELRSRPGLGDVGVLVRPHPGHAEIWRGRILPFPNTAVWKVDYTEPVALAAKNEFYDSIHHSAGVVGLNTSALIESAIVGRPVFTLLTEQFDQSQSGTLHFEMIAGKNGIVDLASSMDDHAAHIAGALSGPTYAHERRRRFLETFVRPRGLNTPATERLVAVLEEQGARRGEPSRDTLGIRAIRVLAFPASFLPWRSKRQTAKLRKERRRGRMRRRRLRKHTHEVRTPAYTPEQQTS